MSESPKVYKTRLLGTNILLDCDSRAAQQSGLGSHSPARFIVVPTLKARTACEGLANCLIRAPSTAYRSVAILGSHHRVIKLQTLIRLMIATAAEGQSYSTEVPQS